MKYWIVLFTTFLILNNSFSQSVDRLFRFPAVHNDQLVFCYAGDLYLVDANGGTARRLTSDVGFEMFPKFSHDGKTIAFTAQYDGNTEVYTMPTAGGTPKRITYTATLNRDDISDRMGPNNIVMDWSVDDQSILYRSRRYTFNSFKGILLKAPVNGGMSEQLPFDVAGWCSYNYDGTKLAYNRVFREFRTWKYYEGGMADDIWIYDTKTESTENITRNDAQDIMPMFYKDKVYFISDRDRIMNIFSYDLNTKSLKKVTNFDLYDVKFPSLSKDKITFENGGHIYILNPENEELNKVDIKINNDLPYSRKREVLAHKNIDSYALSGKNNAIVLSARGDIFTIPEKKGVTRNLSSSSGAFERNVEWSPNGKWISFISDKNGEDEIYIKNLETQKDEKLTSLGTYLYNPVWSPNSQSLLFSDRDFNLYTLNIKSKELKIIYHSEYWEIRDYLWSPDNKWVVFTVPNHRSKETIMAHNLETGKMIQLTEKWYGAHSPTFSRDGKYLFFVGDRNFNATYSRVEWNHAYRELSKIYVINLNKRNQSIFEIQEDEEKPEEKNVEKKIVIDEPGIFDRTEELPMEAGNYWNLQSSEGGLFFQSRKDGAKQRMINCFVLKNKEIKEIGGYGGYLISHDAKKILLSKSKDYFLEDISTNKIDAKNKIDLSNVKMVIDPKEEWKEIFYSSWRQMRDYFYDPNMHGVNWEGIKSKYEVLLPYVAHRHDLNYIMGEMIGELNVGHAYVGGGDVTMPERIKMGLLGATFSNDASGYFKIEKILSGKNWSEQLKSPLKNVGLNIKEGDFILSINGVSLKDYNNIFELLIGKANQIIEIEVNSKPSVDGSRKVLVKTIDDESALYYNEWVEYNRKKVDELSGGRIGYLHIPDMLRNGLNQFSRYFYAQIDKDALIIDDRGNGGGNVSPMIIERLRRQVGLAQVARNSKISDIKPGMTHIGPKVCLIDQYSASDGDLFPYQFRFYEIGKLIGQRTWGGVVGIRGSLPIIDGGYLRKPEFAHFAHDGSKWIIEGEGVSPDIEVVNDPHDVFKGKDAQLEKGVDLLLKELENGAQFSVPQIPPFPDKSK